MIVVHISRSFAAGEGRCFLTMKPATGRDWRRAKLTTALRRWHDRIVRCHCGRPAIYLDHFFPYFSDNNRCELHLGRKSP